MAYQTYNNPITGEPESIKRLADNAFIPFDSDNRDYVEYLAWLDAGNTPAPADAPEEQA